MSVLRCDFFLHNSYHTIFFLISQALYPRPRGASEPCLCACQLRLGSPAPRSEQAPSGRGRRSLATPSSVADEDTEAALVTNITCVTHHVTVRLCLSGNHSGSFYARLFFFFFFCLEFLFLLATCRSPFPPLKHVQVRFLRKALLAYPTDGYYFISSSTEVDLSCGNLNLFVCFLENSSLSLCYL